MKKYPVFRILERMLLFYSILLILILTFPLFVDNMLITVILTFITQEILLICLGYTYVFLHNYLTINTNTAL